jgi:hypothetical protein
LKKRSKKLLGVQGRMVARVSDRQRERTDKSFLVLFFKKELVSCFLFLLQQPEAEV